MAKTLAKSEVARIKKAAEGKVDRKLASQQKQGKEFVNHGQGVIPEEVWKNLPGKTEAK